MILPSPSMATGNLALTVLAMAAYATPAWPRLSAQKARWALWIAWGLHAALLAWGLLGDAPLFGFAPALSVTVWLAAAVYGVESRVYPQMTTHRGLCLLSAGVLLLAWLYPGQTLQARASAWLPLHWALGIASYGLFAVAVAHAVLMLRAEDRIRHATAADAGLPLLTLERLTFRFVGAGFVLLTATLVAGFLFDEQLYGTTWKWSHKIIFSVLSWVVFAVLLWGRMRLGWRGWRAARLLFTGAGLLLLAYVGSRFVMEIILGRTVS